MNVNLLVRGIKDIGIDKMIGVPDSTLSELCGYLNSPQNELFEHYVAPNEGSAVGFAVGTYLGTSKPACVYMQNSGIGNIVNPLTSIANKEVYDIPMLLIIGWRGEPGVHDEPQHKFMGQITTDILELLGVKYSLISKDTEEQEFVSLIKTAKKYLEENKQYALIIKRDSLEKVDYGKFKNDYVLKREDAISCILKFTSGDDIIVTTTGKISREAYEQSDRIKKNHNQIFLTVGGMGHASMIAVALALTKSNKKVVCLDGDGAALMHMGNMAFIGTSSVPNLLHICLNNEAHESVGGMPTGAIDLSYHHIAKECGYTVAETVTTEDELVKALNKLRDFTVPVFIEVKVKMDTRKDLGRPKESAIDNKINFMKYHGVV